MKELKLPVQPYSIGKIEHLLGLPSGSMRYYVVRDLLPQPDIQYGRQRRYSPEATGALLKQWALLRA